MPKSQDKILNILRTKRAFTMKQKAFFIIFEGLSLKQIKKIFFGRWESNFKRYLHEETISRQIMTLKFQWMIVFVWRKNNFLLSRLDFCVFGKSTNFKNCDAIIGIHGPTKTFFLSYARTLLKLLIYLCE